MKKLVRKCLALFGYELRRLPPRIAAKPQAGSAVEHNSREQREHFYSDESQVHGYLNEDRRQFYKEVTEIVRHRIPDFGTAALKVADYGCGPGMLLKEISLATPSSEFFGYDFASAGIRVARENFPRARFSERDIYESFPDRYDLVLCTEVLEHLERPQRALANLLDQLSTGGLLLLTVPDGRVDQYSGHIHFWSPESWKLFLEDACPGPGVETGRIATRSGRAFLYASILRPSERACANASPETSETPESTPRRSHCANPASVRTHERDAGIPCSLVRGIHR